LLVLTTRVIPPFLSNGGAFMSNKSSYPWVRLLDAEIYPKRPEIKKKVGRPKNPFPRKRRRYSSTDDEMERMDKLTALFKERMGNRVDRGHVIAFMEFDLTRRLTGKSGNIELPEHISSFVDLAKYLENQ
jgi:hypothetical protein